MIFRFMEKHRMGILLVILVTMMGFGFWSFLADGLGGQGEEDVEAGKVMATFDLFGEKVEVPKEGLERVGLGATSISSMSSDEAELRLAMFVRESLLESDEAFPVSDATLDRMIEEHLITPAKRENNGVFGPKEMGQLAAAYRMTVPQFKEQLRQDLQKAMTLRELERAGRMPTMQEVFERYKKDYTLLKLKGIFWDAERYAEANKLARDKDGNLTAESEAELKKHWDEMDDDKKREFNKKHSLISTEFLGFDFTQFENDDAVTQAFIKVDPKSKKSLKDLTADISMSETDVNKFKIRLERNRSQYGLAADDDIEKVFEDRKKRWTQEFKVLKLVKKLHDELMQQAKKGETPEYAKLAEANNLTYFKWTDRHILDLRDPEIAFQSVALFGLNSTALPVGSIWEYRASVGPEAPWFFRGPLDQPGRFCASYRLLARDLKPIPKFEGEVKDAVLEAFEKGRAEAKRDEAYDSFQAKMDAITEEKAKDEIAKIKADSEMEIAQAIEGLDPEKDEEKISSITDEKNEDADALIEAEKEKFRDEAFKKVLAENSDLGLVVEEGYFEPFFATREMKHPYKVSSDARARSSLRMEFTSLHDKVWVDEIHEIGKVSPLVESRNYPGLKGIAMIVDKKEPTFEDMMMRPVRMRFAEMSARRSRLMELAEQSMWGKENMKLANFNLDSSVLDAQIVKNETQSEDEDEGIRKWEEENKKRMERLKKEREDAAKPQNVDEQNADNPAGDGN